MLVIVLKNRSNEIRSNEIRIRRELPVLWIDEFQRWAPLDGQRAQTHDQTNVSLKNQF